MTDFPFSLGTDKHRDLLHMFTDDFSLYLRYNKSRQRFYILHLDTGRVHSEIPSDVLNVDEDEKRY